MWQSAGDKGRNSANDDLDNLRTHLSDADNAVTKSDFESARKSLREAVLIAESRNWVNEAASAKTYIAETYLAEKKYELEESTLDDAASSCELSEKCDPNQLTVVFEHTSTLNLQFLKDVKKQRELIEAVSRSPVYIRDGIEVERTCHFISETWSDGFKKEAEEWRSEFGCK